MQSWDHQRRLQAFSSAVLPSFFGGVERGEGDCFIVFAVFVVLGYLCFVL